MSKKTTDIHVDVTVGLLIKCHIEDGKLVTIDFNRDDIKLDGWDIRDDTPTLLSTIADEVAMEGVNITYFKANWERANAERTSNIKDKTLIEAGDEDNVIHIKPATPKTTD